MGHAALTLFWAKPLGDPFGGTSLAGGRHPVKMFEPKAAADAPKEVVYLILGSLQFSEAALRVYGHPQLLAVAAAVNGDDFVPFNEALFIKEPGRGASVAWHQDGVTHWNSPDWDQGSHGFNFMAQLYGCTPANGVWVVPGSHKWGKADIKAMVAAAGSERLPDAVPIVCKPGDVAITNRQAVHGSFANTSPDWRVTVNFGFHRRRSVLGVKGGGVHNEAAVYDAERIRQRARLIGYAIDAQRQRFPEETPYVYKPQIGETWHWDAEARARIRDYNLLDLSI
jgi:ectoine hydroxylase-related dioxygenase (phytanoyl-CoA dioxygenase family)